MAINRRFRNKYQTQDRVQLRKLVTLKLGDERYAIAIEKVVRVVQNFNPQGVLDSGRSLLEHNNETITIIDPSKLFLSSSDLRDRQYLVICTLNQTERLGIPVPEMPGILEIAADKFSEIPAMYQKGNLPKCVEKLIHIADGTIVFYLNLEQFILD